MPYWIIDIIAGRDIEAVGRLVGITTLFVVAALLGWLFMAK